MATPHLSQRVLVLLAELHRRGIRGRAAKMILRKYAQKRIARQIDFYDHEVVFRARLPLWAATPWLVRRIRQDVPVPEGYFSASHSVARLMRVVPYRASGSTVGLRDDG